MILTGDYLNHSLSWCIQPNKLPRMPVLTPHIKEACNTQEELMPFLLSGLHYQQVATLILCLHCHLACITSMCLMVWKESYLVVVLGMKKFKKARYTFLPTTSAMHYYCYYIQLWVYWSSLQIMYYIAQRMGLMVEEQRDRKFGKILKRVRDLD